MSAPVVLAAAGDGAVFLVKILAVMLIFLGPAIWRLLTQAQGAKPPQGPPRPKDAGVQQQIEEFLQRASQRRGVGRPAVSPPPPAAAEPVVAELAPDEPVGGRLLRRVQEDINTSDFRRRGEQMGGDVAQSDKEFQQGVGKEFSDEVSGLAKRPGETAMPVDTTATESEEAVVKAAAETVATSTLGGLLDSPESLVSAIVLNEILRRPEWEG
jgi:hypothetical protein